MEGTGKPSPEAAWSRQGTTRADRWVGVAKGGGGGLRWGVEGSAAQWKTTMKAWDSGAGAVLPWPLPRILADAHQQLTRQAGLQGRRRRRRRAKCGVQESRAWGATPSVSRHLPSAGRDVRSYRTHLLTFLPRTREGYDAFLLRATMLGRIARTGGKGEPKKKVSTKKLSYFYSF
jgi:hypothetical protein